MFSRIQNPAGGVTVLVCLQVYVAIVAKANLEVEEIYQHDMYMFGSAAQFSPLSLSDSAKSDLFVCLCLFMQQSSERSVNWESSP